MSDPEVKVVCADDPANNDNSAILKTDQLQDEEIQRLEKAFLMIDNVRKLEERNVKGLRNSYLKLSHKNKIDHDKINHLSKGLKFIEDEKSKVVFLQKAKKRASERGDLQDNTMKEVNIELSKLQKTKVQAELELSGDSKGVEDELNRKETESGNNIAITECMRKAMDSKSLDMQSKEMAGVEEDEISSREYFEQIENLQGKELDTSKENDRGVDCGIEEDEMEEEKMLEGISDKVTMKENHACLIGKKIEYRKYLIDLLVLEKEQWRKGIDRLYKEEEENAMKIKDLLRKDEELRGHMMKSAFLESEIAELKQQLKIKKRATRFMKWRLLSLQRDANLAETAVNIKKEGLVLDGIIQRPEDFHDTKQTQLPKILSRDEFGKSKEDQNPAPAVKQVPLTGQDEASAQNKTKKDYDDDKDLVSPVDKHRKKSKVVFLKKGRDCNEGNTSASPGKKISKCYSDKDRHWRETSLECKEDYSVQESAYDKEKSSVSPQKTKYRANYFNELETEWRDRQSKGSKQKGNHIRDKDLVASIDKHYKSSSTNSNQSEEEVIPCHSGRYKEEKDCHDEKQLVCAGKKNTKADHDKNKQLKKELLDHEEVRSVPGKDAIDEDRTVSPQKTKYRANYFNELETEWRNRQCKGSEQKGNHIRDKDLVASIDKHYKSSSTNSNQSDEKAIPCHSGRYKEEKDCHDEKQLVCAGKKNTKADHDKNKQLKKELLDHEEVRSVPGKGAIDEDRTVSPQKTKYRANYFNELETEWRNRQCKGSKQKGNQIPDKDLVESIDKHYKSSSANSNQSDEKAIPCNSGRCKEEKDCHDEKQLVSAGKKNTKAHNDKNKQLKKELLDREEVCSVPGEGTFDKEPAVSSQKTKYRASYFNELENECRDGQCKGSKQGRNRIPDNSLTSSEMKYLKGFEEGHSDGKVSRVNKKSLVSSNDKKKGNNHCRQEQLNDEWRSYQDHQTKHRKVSVHDRNPVSLAKKKYRTSYFDEMQDEWFHDRNHPGHYYQRKPKGRKDSKLDNGTTKTRKGRRRLSTRKLDN